MVETTPWMNMITTVVIGGSILAIVGIVVAVLWDHVRYYLP